MSIDQYTSVAFNQLVGATPLGGKIVEISQKCEFSAVLICGFILVIWRELSRTDKARLAVDMTAAAAATVLSRVI
jgi:hypothetical protein